MQTNTRNPWAGMRPAPADRPLPPPVVASRESTALHEAGHAVLALQTGRAIRGVWIYEDSRGGHHGECEARTPMGRAHSAEELVAIAAWLVAGWVAECIGGHREDPCPDDAYPAEAVERERHDPKSRLRSDLKYVRVVAALSGCDHDLLFRLGWDEAKTTLQDHWPAVVAVADALLAHGSLTGEGVRAAARGGSGAAGPGAG